MLNAAALVIAAIEPRLVIAQVGAALATFVHLAVWTVGRPDPGTARQCARDLPGVRRPARGLPGAAQPPAAGHPDPVTGRVSPWFAPLVLVLMLITVLVLPEVPLLVWPAILIADLLVIGLAFGSGAIAAGHRVAGPHPGRRRRPGCCGRLPVIGLADPAAGWWSSSSARCSPRPVSGLAGGAAAAGQTGEPGSAPA